MNYVYNYLFNHNYQPKNAGLIDKHFVYPISHLFSGVAYHLGITPNQITLTTFIIRSYANYNLYYKIPPNWNRKIANSSGKFRINL